MLERAAAEPEVRTLRVQGAGTPRASSEERPTLRRDFVPPNVSPPALRGFVKNELGEPVPGALVFLPRRSTEGAADVRGSVIERETLQHRTDQTGAFAFSRVPWRTIDPALGVAKNGYVRTFVSLDGRDALPGEDLLVVLKRGRAIHGRVVDEEGLGVPYLRLLAHTRRAPIHHVSPTQRALRAYRRRLRGAGTEYQDCLATTDGAGFVTFRGLAEEPCVVRSLDPGFAIAGEGPTLGEHRTWTATRGLGVRIEVVDRTTGKPVSKSSATFRVELEFTDGTRENHGQWVGRGRGEVSFFFGPDLIQFACKDRTIQSATFYGTVGATRQPWQAEPILSSPAGGALGVAQVRVPLDTAVR